jgi:hypothetical protein
VDQQEDALTLETRDGTTAVMDDWQGWLDDDVDHLFVDAPLIGPSERA